MDAEYYWNNETNNWTGEYKYEYAYNLSYSITDLIHPFDIPPSNNMPIEDIYFTWSGTDWIEEGRDVYYWSGKEIIGVSDITKDNSAIKVYPNPTTGQLTIDASACSATNGEFTINNVEIFDIYGRKQNNFQFSIFNSPLKIDISHLSSGIYFVKISTKAGETVRKIVKE